MNWSSLAIGGLCLLALGCGDAAQTNSADAMQGKAADAQTNAAEAARADGAGAADQALVSDFTAPDLEGMVVRNHPEGAQIVTPPRSRGTSPPTLASDPADRAWWIIYAPGVVFTEVNGTPVRDAAHFRDLVNGVTARGEQRSLGHNLGYSTPGAGL